MKKFLSIILFMSILLSCCACGKADKEAAQNEVVVKDEHTMTPEELYGHIDQTQPVDGVYQVWSIVGIQQMTKQPQAKFELLCNVDLEGAVLAPIPEFTGEIQGNNWTIKNFTVEGEGENFGFISTNKGVIDKLYLDGVTLKPSASAKNIGTIAGVNEGQILRGIVTNTSLTVEEASADAACGGIVGMNTGTIVNMNTTVDTVYTAPGAAKVGSLVGVAKGGKLEFLENHGVLTVTGENKTVGLFAGEAMDAVFVSCVFGGADNSLDGELFINFTGNPDDDELLVAQDGLWRDNDLDPVPEKAAVLRDKVVAKMYEMGTIEWHVDKDLLHECQCTQTACVGVYTSDYTYVGMPYKHGSGTMTSFYYCLDENNYMEDWVWDMDSRFGYDTYMGTMCTSAAEMAWWTVCNSVDAPIPNNFLPYYYPENNCIPVGGDWYLKADYNPARDRTDSYIECVSEQEYYEIIAQWHRGDILNQGIDEGVHTIMVATEPVVIRNQKGEIDGSYSYVYTHEQCGGAQIDDEKMTWTTWRLNKKQTFTGLRAKWWVASTCEELLTGEMETPECTILGGAEGRLGLTTGVVQANYFLDAVYLKITDSKGNVVVDRPFFPKANKFDDANQRLTGLAYVDSYDLAYFGMVLQSIMFEPGETYEYTISAHLMTGDDFVLKTDSFTQ